MALNLTAEQKNNIRSTGNKAMFYAQYMRYVHGQQQFLSTIKDCYIATESDVQPSTAEIYERANNLVSIVNEDGAKVSGTTWQLLQHCAAKYEDNARLIDRWIDDNRREFANNWFAESTR